MIVDLENANLSKGNTRERRSRRFRRARRKLFREHPEAAKAKPPRSEPMPGTDLDLDVLFEGTIDWALECLKSSGSFHNMMILIAAQQDVMRVTSFPQTTIFQVGEEPLFEAQPDSLGHIFVPFHDQSPETTFKRLQVALRNDPLRSEGLRMMDAMAQKTDHRNPYGFLVDKLCEIHDCQPMDICMMYIRELTKEMKAKAVFVASETWIYCGERPPNFRGSLRDLPGSKEAIMVALVTRAGVQRARSITFTREEKPGQERGTGPVRSIERGNNFDGLKLTGRLVEVFHPEHQVANA